MCDIVFYDIINEFMLTVTSQAIQILTKFDVIIFQLPVRNQKTLNPQYLIGWPAHSVMWPSLKEENREITISQTGTDLTSSKNWKELVQFL